MNKRFLVKKLNVKNSYYKTYSLEARIEQELNWAFKDNTQNDLPSYKFLDVKEINDNLYVFMELIQK